MKAIVIQEFGGPEQLSYEEVSSPVLGPGQVLVDIHATALNRADLLQRRGMYPPPKGESEILGLECSGVVAKCGDGVDRVGVGHRVMALLAGGGYAEQVVIDQRMAIPVPEGFSFEQAAAIPEAFLTAREALFSKGQLKLGDVVLIHAAGGGVGSAAIQLAKAAGAIVIATAGTDEKLALAGDLGAAHAVNYKTQDFVEVCKEVAPKGVHVVLDFIGGSYWDKHAKVLGTEGKCVIIGVMGGAKADVNLGLVLRKRLQILGLVMRSRSLEEKVAITRRFIDESLPLFEQGRLKPILDQTFALTDAKAAHERMEQNLNLGKIILKVR